MTVCAQRTARVADQPGIHLRAAGALVRLVESFQSEIWIENDEGYRVNGRSIMGVLSLAASKDTELRVSATGVDAHKAVEAVAAFLEGSRGSKEERR